MTTSSGVDGALERSGGATTKTDGSTRTAGVVHDLANVLTVVLGSLEQLHRQPLDERGLRHLERAEWAAQRAVRLATRTLDEVKREVVADGSAAELVDVNEAVRAFAAAVDQSSVEHSGQFAVELAAGQLLARLDEEQLQLALLNLVRNAQDATAEGGRITLRTYAHRVDGLGGKPTVEIAVSDTGAGMPPEAVRRATEAFFTTKEPGRGAGLGLWRVRNFAEDAGGKVEIDADPGHGTTVRLVLPRFQPSDAPGSRV